MKTTRYMLKTSLGKFTNFPTIIHGIAKVTYNDHPAKVQRTIVQAFHKLNGSNKKCPISVSGRAGTYKGRVGFEVGVAEGIFFNYLNDEMTKKLSKSITSRKLYPILDFLIIVTYHYNSKGKNIHLNFDYHQLRFIFNIDELEMRLFHSKGIRRMPLDEFLDRILDCINGEMKQQSLTSLAFKELNVL